MPSVKNYDSAYRGELLQRFGYELWLLDFYQSRRFAQSEDQVVNFTLGDTNAMGELVANHEVKLVTRISDGAVKEVLEYFDILAFTTAFKLQDMIVEWIMRANGENAWRFKEKLDAYDRFLKAGTLHQPQEFTRKPHIANAFWELYRKFVNARNALTHGPIARYGSNGFLLEIDKGKPSLPFDVHMQAAYLRIVGLVAAELISLKGVFNSYHDALVENDLATLAPIHGTSSFKKRSIRFTALRLKVGKKSAKQLDPYICNIDFPYFRRRMEKMFPVGTGGELFYTFEVIAKADGRDLFWGIPPEKIPNASQELREDDPLFQPFLKIMLEPV